MASKQIRITDTFQDNICGICGCQEINQYFGVNDSFIEYCGVFYSFREILSEALSIQIDHNAGKTMEICLDCKDKSIKFYHFKRKVKEVQQSHKNNRVAKDSSKISEKRSKIVHNIYQIIENYTEKCSVATIRVNEKNKKLIIESGESMATPKEEIAQAPAVEYHQVEPPIYLQQQSSPATSAPQQCETDIFGEASVLIKEEPLELGNAIRYAHAEDNDEDEMGMEDDSYSNNDYYTTASTSHYMPPSAKKPRKDEELLFQPDPNAKLRIPVESEKEVYELAYRLAHDESFSKKLGSDIVNQRQFVDSPETAVRSVIRRMMKAIIAEEMCNRMNTTGRSSKLSANCDGNSVKAIKTPESIMRFIARYSAILTAMNEEDAYVEVKKVITRWISDERNNKFLRKNRRLKQRIERQMMTMVGGSQYDPIIPIPSASHMRTSPIVELIAPSNMSNHHHEYQDPLSHM